MIFTHSNLSRPEQHWSLMPLHAVCSTIRPASNMYGAGAHYGGNPIAFPQWLGQNSKQSKLMRQLGDVQIRMRLKVSGDKNEIRQSYIPALYPHIVKPLIDNGAVRVLFLTLIAGIDWLMFGGLLGRGG